MGDNKLNLSDLLETHRRDRERLAWEGTFRDYFELVSQNPNIAKLSHARSCDMILAAGVEKINVGSRDEIVKYNFFSDELFGIERPISKIVEYFKSAGQRLEVGERMQVVGRAGGLPVLRGSLCEAHVAALTRAAGGARAPTAK